MILQYLAYPAGLIKGALQRLGIPGAVIPEITTLPQCAYECDCMWLVSKPSPLGTFQVKLAKTS